MAKPTDKISKFQGLVKRYRKHVVILMVMVFLIKLNKTVFFISLFTILAYLLKYIRGMFGLKMVVLDTLHFSAIMMAKFIGLKEAVILVAINTLVIDFLTFIASDGTFANFLLYSFTSVFAVSVFGGTNLPVIYGTVAAFMYSVLYFSYRQVVATQAPFEVVAKCITSFIFTFLYCSFFGPILGILMSV